MAFQNKISDFCFARKTEKEELLKDVTRQASSTAAGVNAPPARPPPPTNVPAAAPAAPNPYAGAPATNPNYPPQGTAPYPQFPQMPLPFQQQTTPYPQQMGYTPMPASFNPYATYPPPASMLYYSYKWLKFL